MIQIESTRNGKGSAEPLIRLDNRMIVTGTSMRLPIFCPHLLGEVGILVRGRGPRGERRSFDGPVVSGHLRKG